MKIYEMHTLFYEIYLVVLYVNSLCYSSMNTRQTTRGEGSIVDEGKFSILIAEYSTQDSTYKENFL